MAEAVSVEIKVPRDRDCEHCISELSDSQVDRIQLAFGGATFAHAKGRRVTVAYAGEAVEGGVRATPSGLRTQGVVQTVSMPDCIWDGPTAKELCPWHVEVLRAWCSAFSALVRASGEKSRACERAPR